MQPHPWKKKLKKKIDENSWRKKEKKKGKAINISSATFPPHFLFLFLSFEGKFLRSFCYPAYEISTLVPMSNASCNLILVQQ